MTRVTTFCCCAKYQNLDKKSNFCKYSLQIEMSWFFLHRWDDHLALWFWMLVSHYGWWRCRRQHLRSCTCWLIYKHPSGIQTKKLQCSSLLMLRMSSKFIHGAFAFRHSLNSPLKWMNSISDQNSYRNDIIPLGFGMTFVSWVFRMDLESPGWPGFWTVDDGTWNLSTRALNLYLTQ